MKGPWFLSFFLLPSLLFGKDEVKPIVSIVQPSSETLEVKGEVLFEAAASDNLQLDFVQLWIDGKPLQAIGKDFPFLWQVDSSTLSEGVHPYQFKAVDQCGNEALSKVQQVKVVNGISVSPSPSPLPSPSPSPLPSPLPSIPSAQGEDDSCQGLSLKSWPQDAQGWTILSSAERLIFVTASPFQKPDGENVFVVLTPEEGAKLLRAGHADQLLFKRGETFTLRGSLPQPNLGGKDADHLMVIGAFGAGARPKLNFPGNLGLLNLSGEGPSHLAVVSLDMDGTLGTAEAAIRHVAKNTENLLIEDVRVVGFTNGLALDTQGGAKNIVIRRSQFVGNYSKGGANSEGIYADRIAGLRIEESFFDSNGYKVRNGPFPATMFNHNAYIQSLNSCFRYSRNVSMRGAASGLQARAGGVIEDNLFIENPLHMTFGLVKGGSIDSLSIKPGISGRVVRNVFLNGTDINATQLTTGQFEAGNISHALIAENIFAHHLRGASAGAAYFIKAIMGIGVHNLRFEKNIAFDVKSKLMFEGPAFGPVQLKGETVECARYNAKGEKVQVSVTGASVYAGASRLFSPCESGMAKELAPRNIADAGSVFVDNILQTTSSDFLSFASSPKPSVKMEKVQTSSVKFKDPLRVPAVASLSNLKGMDKLNWNNNALAPSWNTWMREGFRTLP